MTLNAYFDYVIFPILTISVVMVIIRLFKGPDVVDRVVTLDLVITIGIATVAAYCVRMKQAIYLDVAMIFALIAFLGTVAFSYYINKKNNND